MLGRHRRPGHGAQPREPETAFSGLDGLPIMRTVMASAILRARSRRRHDTRGSGHRPDTLYQALAAFTAYLEHSHRRT
jgi:hypothetical protein